MFFQKSDSALSSSCYGAGFRGTRVWTCSQLNSWASIKRRGRGGGVLISNIAHEGGTYSRKYGNYRSWKLRDIALPVGGRAVWSENNIARAFGLFLALLVNPDSRWARGEWLVVSKESAIGGVQIVFLHEMTLRSTIEIVLIKKYSQVQEVNSPNLSKRNV